MGIKIEYTRKRSGYGKKGNPHMEGQSLLKRGKWNAKERRYDPVVIDPEKKIVDKKKPYRKPKKKIGKRAGPSMRGKSRKK